MAEIGYLKVKLDCDADEFLATCNASRAALEAVAKAADEANEALSRLYATQMRVDLEASVNKALREGKIGINRAREIIGHGPLSSVG